MKKTFRQVVLNIDEFSLTPFRLMTITSGPFGYKELHQKIVEKPKSTIIHRELCWHFISRFTTTHQNNILN